MSASGWRAPSILAGLLLMLGTFYILASKLDAAATFPQRATLRSLVRLDAELSRDLLLLRVGLLRYYDPVNATVAAMHERFARLQRDTPDSLKENLVALAAAIESSEEYVESIKSDVAVSRNSIMYMTFLMDRRFEQVASGESAVLNALLARLNNTLVRHIYNPSGSARESARALLHDIAMHAWPAPLRPDVQDLTVHGNVVLERAARIDATLAILRTDPLGAMVQRVEQTHIEYARAAAQRARVYWVAIFGLALLFALYAAYAVLRLRNVARELARSETSFRATFEQAAMGLAHVAPDGTFLRINQKLCDILGYSKQELLIRTFQDITHPGDLEMGVINMHKLLDGRIATFALEKRYIKKDGSPIWANLTVALVHTPTGEPDYFISAIEDIGTRKHTEQERERLAALVDASSEFIATATLDGRMTYVNSAGCKMLGLDPASVVEKVIPDFVSPSFLSDVENSILPATIRDGFWSGEFRLRHFVTGEEITVQQYVFAIKDPRTGAPLWIANISHDIRNRKQAEQEIRRLNAELEQRVRARTAQLEAANAQLDAFAYSASHDLRTPLRAIDGFSQALLDDCGPELSSTGRSHLARIRTAAQRMGKLIDDLLHFSRVTRSKFDSSDVDLSRLAHEVLGRWAELEPDRHVDLQVAMGLRARGAPPLVAIVLENILGNAWKYTSKTPSARIEFAAEQRGDETVFYVRDNGVGFDMQYAGKLFGVFQRMHGIDEFAGSGIGLATVANIINRHGGRIWAESAPNQGATFYFTLPEVVAA